MCAAVFRRNTAPLLMLEVVPTLSQCRDFCEVPRHDPGAFMEIVVFPASSGSTGRKKEESAHFQPITCYVWFLPDAIPSWQSLKPKQFLRHPFDLTKRETSEGAMPWSSVIKSVRGTQ